MAPAKTALGDVDMSADRGITFPFAAISVVALFLSTTFLGQHAFDLLRLAEGDAAKQRQFTQPPVEARLWEDPLAALVRHRAKLKEICPPVGVKDAPPADPRCPFDAVDSATLQADLARASGELTVIAALVPGASFVGVEEARRRIRYAVLGGLGAEGFVPDNSERMGLLTSAKIDIPYEMFSTEKEGEKRRRVAVLWINDFAIGKDWLSALTVLLGNVAPPTARLRILGPYDSDALVDALDDGFASLLLDLGTISLETHERGLATYRKHASVLSRLQFISPSSTASAERLVSKVSRPVPAAPLDCPQPDGVDRAFKDRLARFGLPKPIECQPFFVRTIGTDDRNLALLIRELCVRGLRDGNGGRIVVLREWDSIYARDFAKKLKDGFDTFNCGRAPNARLDDKASVEVFSYLRGLDGANVDGAPKQQRLVPRATGAKSKAEDNEPEIEWPETRDQRDYVRRLVRRLQQNAEDGDGKDRVRAVGVIGVDVHDKLILAQALRAAFPDRLLFTTDLDARLLHPQMLKHTRNLIIASSLPLEPPVPAGAQAEVKVPPFRDVYQTGTFLGARYAVASEEDRQKHLAFIAEQLGKDHLFEVGSAGQVELSTTKADSEKSPQGKSAAQGAEPSPEESSEKSRRQDFAVLSLFILVVIGWLMLFGKPAPAMKTAVMSSDTWFGSFDLSTAILCGLGAAALGFGLGVVSELAAPGALGLCRVILIALTTMALFWATVYPGPRQGERGIDKKAEQLRRRRLRWQRLRWVAIVLVVAILLWWLLPPSGYEPGMREPFAALNGVSAWPSQLLRTLGVLLFAWFLDYTWKKSAETTVEIGTRYFEVKARNTRRFEGLAVAFRRLGWRVARAVRAFKPTDGDFWVRRRLQLWEFLRDSSIWFWQPQVEWRDKRRRAAAREGRVDDGGIDGARLWRRYLRLLRNGPRFVRMVIWLAVVVVLVWVLMAVLGGEQPEVPARGLDDRALFFATIMLSVIGTMTLLVLVGDATILTWRFIVVLRDHRTVYPQTTVDRFAAELGTKLPAEAWFPIAARVEDRHDNPPPPGSPEPRNSVLDDWIDARLLAEHTAAIGPLIVFPFILLGLLIVARSPLFDNWAANGPVMYALVGYLLWSVTMAVMLNHGAEIARRKAIASMEKDRIWLEGAGDNYKMLAKQFPNLIDQVRNLRQGAFAPFFEQPLVRAILVPLGGAGGIQLLEFLAFARS